MKEVSAGRVVAVEDGAGRGSSGGFGEYGIALVVPYLHSFTNTSFLRLSTAISSKVLPHVDQRKLHLRASIVLDVSNP